ncbi:MAG TPA: aspartyl protease family protein [Steroidobacteraceae bacterium]
MAEATASDIALQSAAPYASAVLSRRCVIVYVAASFAYLPLMAVGSEVNSRRDSFVPRQNDAPAPPDDPTLGTRTDLAQRLTVAVWIGGSGPYQFIVDTGAERSVLAEDIANALNLARGENVVLDGAIRQLTTGTVAVPSLSMGAVSRSNLEVPTLPRLLLEADGYLGLDVLDGCRVTFDFKKHTLQVGSPQTKLRSILSWPGALRVRSTGRSGHLRVIRCIVDDVPATAFIDTGAEISAGNRPLLEALLSRHPGYLEAGEVPLTDVTGGAISGHVVTTGLIRMNALRFSAGSIVIADLPVFDVWGLNKAPALLIGMNYLRQFARVSVDYPLNEIQFELTHVFGGDRSLVDAQRSRWPRLANIV